MNEETQDSILIDYALGRLDFAETSLLEERLKGDVQLRERLFEIQKKMEQQVVALQLGEHASEFDRTKVKTAVMDSISGRYGIAEKSSGLTLEKNDTLRRGYLPWIWGTLGLAAAVIVAVSVVLFGVSNAFQSTEGVGPAIAVFDIDDFTEQAFYDLQNGSQVRELLFVNAKNYDSLARAEVYAEQLWQEHLNALKDGVTPNQNEGFVVMDLFNNQGFAGFYGEQSDAVSESSDPGVPSVANGNVHRASAEASMPRSPGVFYFKLDGDDFHISGMNEFVSVDRSEGI